MQRTFELNLERLRSGIEEFGLDPALREQVAARIERLAEEIERAPKSRRWELGGRIGVRKQCYEDPEEVDRPEPSAPG